MSTTQRIEMRVDTETKKMADLASAALGCNVTQYISRLIRENAPRVLEEQSKIVLTNQQFDQFIAICKEGKPLSQRIHDVAKRLDTEGF